MKNGGRQGERTQARMEEKEKGGGYDGTRARQREG